MTITVDIKPEVQAELARQATAHGRAIEVHAASLLEEAVHLPATDQQPRDLSRKSLREVFEAVRGLEDDVDFSRNPATGRPVDLS
jgi:hypothetical protein